MSIEIAYLGEPKLQFNSYFEHQDAKTGLAEFGPFGRCIEGLHPETIRLGFVGTRATVDGARGWVEECGRPIESENVRVLNPATPLGLFGDEETSLGEQTRWKKMLNRDFPGFSRETTFASRFQTNRRWERILLPKDIKRNLMSEDKASRIAGLVDLFAAEVEGLATTSPAPDVVVLALTNEMVNLADRVRVSGGYWLDFRRALKAKVMKWGVPVQLLQERTVTGKGEMQEKATRAWNFCTAQYYKADGIPWRPVSLSQETCYIGISFYVARETEGHLTVRSSLAQAFDFMGQGLVLRGDPFEWDEYKLGRSPHLTSEAARKLLKETLTEYTAIKGLPPRRVVIHKTTVFWSDEHPEHNEVEGFAAAVEEAFPRAETDFVSLRQTGIRLFREGIYPPLRGTYFCLEDNEHFVYTTGYTPYLQTYPGVYVPEPWHLTQHIGGTSPRELLREALALTKMNVNNCSFADGVPITLSFARRIGEIMKHAEDGAVQRSYKYYI